MARKLPQLGEAVVVQIESAWRQPQPDWARQRLLVVRLIAQHEMTVAQIRILFLADQSLTSVNRFSTTALAPVVAGVVAVARHPSAAPNRLSFATRLSPLKWMEPS